jgi:hypothetical protein
MIEYNKATFQANHPLCIDILKRLHGLLEQNPAVRKQNFPPGYFLKCISGQMDHSISQQRHKEEEQGRRRQEDEQRHRKDQERRQQEEEQERRHQEEEMEQERIRQDLKKEKVKECHAAINKGHYGTVTTILDLPDIRTDTTVLQQLIETAKLGYNQVKGCRDEWTKDITLRILQYLQNASKQRCLTYGDLEELLDDSTAKKQHANCNMAETPKTKLALVSKQLGMSWSFSVSSSLFEVFMHVVITIGSRVVHLTS